MSERTNFEARFPMPPGVEWSDKLNDYTYTDFRALGNVCKYSGQWQAWQAARAGGEPVAEVARTFSAVEHDVQPIYVHDTLPAGTKLYTHPPAKVPEGWLSDVMAERDRQDQKWGGPEHDDQHSPEFFVQLIQDYAGWARVMAGMGSFEKFRRRMIQVAALAGAAVEATDRALERASNPPQQEGE